MKKVKPDNLDWELCKAATLNMTASIRFLLEAGANPDAMNNRSDTPLMLACYNGNIEAVAILAPVTNCDVANKYGFTAFDYAESRWEPAIYTLLVPHMDIHAPSKRINPRPTIWEFAQRYVHLKDKADHYGSDYQLLMAQFVAAVEAKEIETALVTGVVSPSKKGARL